jgi:hypothetical protein
MEVRQGRNQQEAAGKQNNNAFLKTMFDLLVSRILDFSSLKVEELRSSETS